MHLCRQNPSSPLTMLWNTRHFSFNVSPDCRYLGWGLLLIVLWVPDMKVTSPVFISSDAPPHCNSIDCVWQQVSETDKAVGGKSAAFKPARWLVVGRGRRFVLRRGGVGAQTDLSRFPFERLQQRRLHPPQTPQRSETVCPRWERLWASRRNQSFALLSSLDAKMLMEICSWLLVKLEEGMELPPSQFHRIRNDIFGSILSIFLEKSNGMFHCVPCNT